MKVQKQELEQCWIFSVRFWPDADARVPRRAAIVGPARSSTVEAALHAAVMPEEIRTEVRSEETVRQFVEGKLDPESNGYYAPCPFPASRSWVVCIASIHEVLR